MNFIKRAFFSVKSRLGKSLLMLFIFTVISVLVLSGLTIQTAADKSSILARQQLGGSVTLQFDIEKAIDNQATTNNEGRRFRFQSTPVPIEDAEELLSSPYVKSYNFLSSTTAIANDFEPIQNETEDEQSETENMSQGRNLPQFSADITLQGVSFTEITSSFSDGTSTLVEGRHITEDDINQNVAIIEQTLANENELRIGDSITVQSTLNEEEVLTLEIIGIYKTTANVEGQLANFEFSLPNNQIYVPYSIAALLKGEENVEGIDQAIYFIDDPINLEKFINEAKENSSIDFDTFKLDANEQLYEQMMGPIENVASFSSKTVYLVTIAGSIILALIVMMTIRERKYEMGVLLAIGEKTWKLVGQFLVEILFIAIFSIVISSISGNYIANQISDQLLNQQIAQAEQDPNVPPGFRRGRMGFIPSQSNLDNVEPIDDLNVNVTSKNIFTLTGVGLLIAILSTLLPSISIIRLHPKTILSKQD